MQGLQNKFSYPKFSYPNFTHKGKEALPLYPFQQKNQTLLVINTKDISPRVHVALDRKIHVLALGFLLLLLPLLWGCGSSSDPDVSGFQPKYQLQRFEEGFFSLDTLSDAAKLKQDLLSLQQNYPGFADDFTTYILGVGKISDSMPPPALQAVQFFRKNYQSVFQELENSRKEFTRIKPQLDELFQHFMFYFPPFDVPNVFTYVGPFDAPGAALTTHGLAIGLQLFGGKDFFFYQTVQGQELFPQYISRRFEPAYIPVRAAQVILDDLFPAPPEKNTLIDQMLEGGKKWYALEKLLPKAPDSLLTGFTQAQLEFCEKNEGAVWNLILKNTDLYTIDPGIIQLYIGDAPTTQGFPESAPGNIGQYLGWKIVQKYMSKNPGTPLQSLLEMDARKIYQDAGYKPR